MKSKNKVDTPYKNSWADKMKRGVLKFDKPKCPFIIVHIPDRTKHK